MPRSKKLLRYSISFIAVFFAGLAIDLACGPEPDPYDYYVSFFHNNVQGEKEYGSFYLNTYENVFDDTEPASEADINSNEWAKYLGHGVKVEDVKKAMYQLSRNDDSLITAEKLLVLNKLPDSLKSNSFLNLLASGNNPGALQYYQFAKSVESEANVAYDRWNPIPIDTLSLQRDGFEALKKANAEGDKFLKLRYLYQAERLLHYSGNFKQGVNIYDNEIALFPSDSHVKGWALALKAGEERHLGDTLRAAYLFAKIFAQYPERRIQAYRNFHYCSKPAREVAQLAENDKDRALIYGVDGFGDPDLNLSYLRMAYRYDPASDMIGVLLVREINKLEDSYLTPKLNSNETDNYNYYNGDKEGTIEKASLLHLDSLKQFCIGLAQDGKYPEAGLGYLSAAYLTWMEGGHTDEGFALLNKMNAKGRNSKLTDQKQLVRLLLNAQSIKTLDDASEAALLPNLKWLDERRKRENDSLKRVRSGPANSYDDGWSNLGMFGKSERDFFSLVLAQQYLRQKDTAKAALCIYKSENLTDVSIGQRSDTLHSVGNALPVFWLHELSSSNLNQEIGWKQNEQQNGYMKFLTKPLQGTVNNDLYELLGTAYIREHNYAMAVNAFNQMQGKFKASFYNSSDGFSDPFISQVLDYPKTFLRAGSKSYDKLMYSKALLDLQTKIKSDPQHAPGYYYQLATGLYNASTYGNAYYLISYEWSAYDYGRENHYSYDDDYIKTKTAETYYLKARSLSASAEFKAKCTFMAAKCRQKQYVIPDNAYGEPDDKYRKQVRRNPYFAELRKNYAQTAFYHTAVQECSYLKDFLASSSKK